MRFSAIVATAFAATAFAMPAYKVQEVDKVKVVTVTAGTYEATHAAYMQKQHHHKAPAHYAPKPSGPGFLQHGHEHSKPSYSGNVGDSAGNNQGILDTYNMWRSRYGLQPMTWDDTLENNAKQTGAMNGGSSENHHLDSGVAEGQIITPGKGPDDTYLGCSGFALAMISWLCEVPSDSELSTSIGGLGVCKLVNKYGMRFNDRGHHDIIVSPKYSKLGCAFTSSGKGGNYNGIWVCTVAP